MYEYQEYERLPPDIGQDWCGTTNLQGGTNEAGKECETGLLTSGVSMKLRDLKLSQRF
jgi:hypothetical protein